MRSCRMRAPQGLEAGSEKFLAKYKLPIVKPHSAPEDWAGWRWSGGAGSGSIRACPALGDCTPVLAIVGEEHWGWDVAGLLTVPALVVFNGLFVAAEFALVSVRKTRVEEMV